MEPQRSPIWILSIVVLFFGALLALVMFQDELGLNRTHPHVDYGVYQAETEQEMLRRREGRRYFLVAEEHAKKLHSRLDCPEIPKPKSDKELYELDIYFIHNRRVVNKMGFFHDSLNFCARCVE